MERLKVFTNNYAFNLNVLLKVRANNFAIFINNACTKYRCIYFTLLQFWWHRFVGKAVHSLPYISAFGRCTNRDKSDIQNSLKFCSLEHWADKERINKQHTEWECKIAIYEKSHTNYSKLLQPSQRIGVICILYFRVIQESLLFFHKRLFINFV